MGATLVKRSHGGFLSKLETTGATYQNNVDKDGGYLGQMKPWGLPKQIGNNGGYLWQPRPTKVMGAFCM